MELKEFTSSLPKGRPLLLLDADEVLLRFVEHLEGHLPTVGYELRLTSFQLGGNIFSTRDAVAAKPEDVKALIAGFFESCAHDVRLCQEPVKRSQPSRQTMKLRFSAIFLITAAKPVCKTCATTASTFRYLPIGVKKALLLHILPNTTTRRSCLLMTCRHSINLSPSMHQTSTAFILWQTLALRP